MPMAATRRPAKSSGDARLERRVEAAAQRYRKLQAAADEALVARDELIREAIEAKLMPRWRLAVLTELTPGRIDQIWWKRKPPASSA